VVGTEEYVTDGQGTESALETIPVDQNDIPAFRAMMIDYLTEMMPGLRPRDVWSESDLAVLRTEPNRWLWWAVVDGERIGLANLRVYEHWHNPKVLVGSIAEFYIRPESRRHGYGRSLAERALEYLWELNVDYIELEVLYGNDRALAFWGAVGFEIHKYRMILD
jgi:ribosomal protein S18 acetylase RimI-like enzyme